jgi:predicted transcriptional regulator
MTIELPQAIETELRTVAEKQGRDILAVIEDAVQQYLDGTSITDLAPADVAEAQISVLGELSASSDWHGDPT